MSDEKKTVIDDSDCDDCVDDEGDTHLVYKPKTSGKIDLYQFTPKLIEKQRQYQISLIQDHLFQEIFFMNSGRLRHYKDSPGCSQKPSGSGSSFGLLSFCCYWLDVFTRYS